MRQNCIEQAQAAAAAAAAAESCCVNQTKLSSAPAGCCIRLTTANCQRCLSLRATSWHIRTCVNMTTRPSTQHTANRCNFDVEIWNENESEQGTLHSVKLQNP